MHLLATSKFLEKDSLLSQPLRQPLGIQRGKFSQSCYTPQTHGFEQCRTWVEQSKRQGGNLLRFRNDGHAIPPPRCNRCSIGIQRDGNVDVKTFLKERGKKPGGNLFGRAKKTPESLDIHRDQIRSLVLHSWRKVLCTG